MIILFVWALRSELEHVLNGFDIFSYHLISQWWRLWGYDSKVLTGFWLKGINRPLRTNLQRIRWKSCIKHLTRRIESLLIPHLCEFVVDFYSSDVLEMEQLAEYVITISLFHV